MTNRLIENGHRRIAFLGTATSWPMIEQRFAGYREALQAAGIPFDPALARFEGEWNAASGGRMTEALCEIHEPPTAILAGNDLLAMGALAALKGRGLRIPGDVCVAGFDDFAFSEHTDPPLTPVRVPGFDLGRRAAVRLIAQIEGREDGPVSERLPVELVIRCSA
jgi:LacI family repressor for deo operon, udp, cdd, tsx, nupC, and nupG